MNVEGKHFYHISRKTDWIASDELIVGYHDNPFWLQSKDYQPSIVCDNISYDLFSFFRNYNGDAFDITRENIAWLFDQFKTTTKECAFYIREQIFEKVRLEIDPLLPSRHVCLWLSDGENLEYWKTEMGKNAENGTQLTLELNGNVFVADESWLHITSLSSDEYTRRAKSYWCGEMSTNPHFECIFTGRAVVKQILPLIK